MDDERELVEELRRLVARALTVERVDTFKRLRRLTGVVVHLPRDATRTRLVYSIQEWLRQTVVSSMTDQQLKLSKFPALPAAAVRQAILGLIGLAEDQNGEEKADDKRIYALRRLGLPDRGPRAVRRMRDEYEFELLGLLARALLTTEDAAPPNWLVRSVTYQYHYDEQQLLSRIDTTYCLEAKTGVREFGVDHTSSEEQQGRNLVALDGVHLLRERHPTRTSISLDFQLPLTRPGDVRSFGYSLEPRIRATGDHVLAVTGHIRVSQVVYKLFFQKPPARIWWFADVRPHLDTAPDVLSPANATRELVPSPEVSYTFALLRSDRYYGLNWT